jgi:preprotein translocase subunit SecE
VARNRQRAKERQAQRRAARDEARGTRGDGGTGSTGAAIPGVTGDAPQVPEAPPEELGSSGYTYEHTSEAEEFIGDLQIGDDGLEELEELDEGADDAAVAGPRGVRGGREREQEEHHERGRVLGFLHAVWLELQRVQWPNRAQLTSLTGITLLFVLVVGGYLGLLDAVFSKLVSAIL